MVHSINKRERIPKGQSQMENPETRATLKVHKTMKNKTKTQNNMCWTTLCANKYKYLFLNSMHFLDHPRIALIYIKYI